MTALQGHLAQGQQRVVAPTAAVALVDNLLQQPLIAIGDRPLVPAGRLLVDATGSSELSAEGMTIFLETTYGKNRARLHVYANASAVRLVEGW